MAATDDTPAGRYPDEAGTSLTTVDAEALARLEPDAAAARLEAALERDGAVVVRNLVPRALCERIRRDLGPRFDADRPDRSGFFPRTTRRAHGVLAYSDAAAELFADADGLFLRLADRVLASRYSYWEGQRRKSVVGRPQIASIVGFRVEPGGAQQALHRDDADYHARNCDFPVMLGCVTALTRTTRENGATVIIPKSHKWGPDRCPYDDEAIPAELDVGDATIFVGNVYHAGGANVTRDEARETIGVFLCKGTLRQEENAYLEIPPETAKARGFSPRLLRLLGYGVCPPALGLYHYQDPIKVIFGVEDAETVQK